MSGRPRKASDADVFAAAVRVMSRVGPAELTLAAIAAEAGLTAGALVQRFGGKRELLRAMSEQLAEATPDMLGQLRAESPSAIETLRAWARCTASLAPSPEGLARNLAYLHLDLTDPELHRHLLKQARQTRAGFARLVDEAIAAGDLPAGTDVAALARAVDVTLTGSLMTWAIHREGDAATCLLEDLDALLTRAGSQPSGTPSKKSTRPVSSEYSAPTTSRRRSRISSASKGDPRRR